MENTVIKPRSVFQRAGFALLAFILAGEGLAVILTLLLTLAGALGLDVSINDTLKLLVNYIPIYGIGFLVFWLVFHSVPKQTIRKEKFSFGRLMAILLICYGMIYPLNIIGSLITSLFGGNLAGEAIMELTTMDSPFAFLIVVLAGPFVEELIFRKLLLDRTVRCGEKTAIIFSALCFGLMHMNFTQFLYSFALGLVLGYVYCKSGKIHYTMILHMIINGISTLLSIAYVRAMKEMPALANLDASSIGEIMEGSGSMNITFSGIIWMLIYIVLTLLILVFTVIGIIMLIKKARYVRFDCSSPEFIPKGQVFKNVYLNAGVIIYVVLCGAMIIVSLFGLISI